MISASGIELRAGSQLLLADGSLRVGKGDRIGLVGRNGAGKTTLTRCLAGESLPAQGTVSSTGTVGYLPQDPRSGDPDELAGIGSSAPAACRRSCGACTRPRCGWTIPIRPPGSGW